MEAPVPRVLVIRSQSCSADRLNQTLYMLVQLARRSESISLPKLVHPSSGCVHRFSPNRLRGMPTTWMADLSSGQCRSRIWLAPGQTGLLSRTHRSSCCASCATQFPPCRALVRLLDHRHNMRSEIFSLQPCTIDEWLTGWFPRLLRKTCCVTTVMNRRRSRARHGTNHHHISRAM